MSRKILAALCSLTSAMILGGVHDDGLATVRRGVDTGLGDMARGGGVSGADDNMVNGGVGFFNAAPMPFTGVPGTRFTGNQLWYELMETPGSFPLEGKQEYAFKSYRMFGAPYSNGGSWIARHVEWWHRIDLASTDKQGTFFNGAFSQFATNIKNGEIPAGRPMWMQGMYIRPLDVSVTDGSLRSNYSASGVVTTTIANQIALQKTLSTGILTFTTNSGRDEQFRVPGIDRFLPGGGLDMQTSTMSGTGLAAGFAANNLPNGGPKAFPGYILSEPIPLLPGRSFGAVMDFQAATLPAATGFIVGVYGVEIVSANFK